MQYVNLGRTGLNVSRLSLGMMTYGTPQWRPWVLEEDASRPLVRRAVELGINFFDTADMYSAGESEVLTGKFVREFMNRDEVVIATKVFMPVQLDFKGLNSPGNKATTPAPNTSGLSRKRIFAAVDASLRRLGTDYIDLYQIHRWDPATPVEEFMEALHDVVKAGKVRYIGASSMWAWQFAKAQHVAERHGWTRFVSMQNHYNLAYREEEREMLPLVRDQGVACLPWSPLARGFLAGNRKADDKSAGATSRARTDDIAQSYYYSDADFAVAKALGDVASARGVNPAQIAYAWLLSPLSAGGGVTAPIVGCSKLAQLDDAVAATELVLTAEEVATLEAPYQPKRVFGHK